MPALTVEQRLNFFSLPAEIRRIIYFYLVGADEPSKYIYSIPFEDPHSRSVGWVQPDDTELLRVNRQFHYEATAQFYLANIFRLFLPNHDYFAFPKSNPHLIYIRKCHFDLAEIDRKARSLTGHAAEINAQHKAMQRIMRGFVDAIRQMRYLEFLFLEIGLSTINAYIGKIPRGPCHIEQDSCMSALCATFEQLRGIKNVYIHAGRNPNSYYLRLLESVMMSHLGQMPPLLEYPSYRELLQELEDGSEDFPQKAHARSCRAKLPRSMAIAVFFDPETRLDSKNLWEVARAGEHCRDRKVIAELKAWPSTKGCYPRGPLPHEGDTPPCRCPFNEPGAI